MIQSPDSLQHAEMEPGAKESSASTLDMRTLAGNMETIGSVPARYSYNTLDCKLPQIRLLTLEPAENYHDPINGILHTEMLSDDPWYEALSYVWGEDAAQACPVYVDERVIKVTPNLNEALRNVRYKCQPRTLWIDAICINQADVREKNHQVSQMRTIYMSAAEVLVWLGASSDDDITWTMEFFASEGKKSPDDRNFPRDGSEEHTKLFIGLNKLFQKPWWSRVWVMQEYALSRNLPRVGCGAIWIPYWHFHEALESISDREAEFLVKWNWAVPLLLEHVTLWDDRDQEFPLVRLLLASAHRKATNPLDKIFALLGLASGGVRNILDVDYEKPITTIYQQAMFVAMKENGSYSLLIMAVANRQIQGLPSWCIDFSHENWAEHFLELDLLRISGSTCSGKVTPSGIHHDDQTGRLSLDGTAVGVICSSQGLQYGSELPESNSMPFKEGGPTETTARTIACIQKKILACCDIADKSLASRFGKEQSRRLIQEGVIWETLAFDQSLIEASRDKWHETSLQISSKWAVLQYLAEARRPKLLPHTGIDSGPGLYALPPSIDDCELAKIVTTKFASHLSKTASFFTTSNGYIARSWHHVKEGDILCILFWCCNPVVLRSHGDGSYELVTIAWVHGIMHGEFVNDGEFVRQTFHLR